MNSDNLLEEGIEHVNESTSIVNVRYDTVSNDKRKNFLRLIHEQGKTIKEAANYFKINYNTARTISCNFEKNGNIEKLPKGGSFKYSLTTERVTKIESLITYNCQITLREIKELMEAEESNFTISISSIHRCLQELGITLKLAHRELDRVNSHSKIIARKEYSLWFNNYFERD